MRRCYKTRRRCSTERQKPVDLLLPFDKDRDLTP